MVKPHRISVFIPVRNGAATLSRCFESLRQQTVEQDLEIIVADSMSTDGSRDIAFSFGASVLDVPEGTFDHGFTRNLGSKHCSGDLIFYTVQDAWLAEPNLLEKMAAHFNDSSVIAVMGHQAVPHERDKNPMLWYKPVSNARTTTKEMVSRVWFDGLSQEEQQAVVSWDNVVAMYRADALRELPFVKTAFAEDWIWSYQAQLKGWKLLHDSSLLVYHYHHQTYRYTFRTKFTMAYHFNKSLGFQPRFPELLMPLLRIVYHLGKHRSLTWKEKFSWMRHNISAILAAFHAVFDFKMREVIGQQCLEKGYRSYCSAIPQGRQNLEGKASNKSSLLAQDRPLDQIVRKAGDKEQQ